MAEIDRGSIVGALLIDLSKAFDTVPHDKLLIELLNIGCSSSAMSWFASYLSNRKQRVILSFNETTDWKNVLRGVPQGSALSPFLFNIYVRNLPRLSDSSTFQFADDITHSESGPDASEVVNKLENTFYITKEFCDSHELVINPSKTQLLLLHAQKI